MSCFRISNSPNTSASSSGLKEEKTDQPLLLKSDRSSTGFSSLSEELYLQIFQYLSTQDLSSASLVSRLWCIISNDNRLWASSCEEMQITTSGPRLPLHILYKIKILEGDRELLQNVIPSLSNAKFLDILSNITHKIEQYNEEQALLKASKDTLDPVSYLNKNKQIDVKRQKAIRKFKADKDRLTQELKKVYNKVTQEFNGAFILSAKKIEKIAIILETEADKPSRWFNKIRFKSDPKAHTQLIYLWAARYGTVVTLRALVEQQKATIPTQATIDKFHIFPLKHAIDQKNYAMVNYLLTTRYASHSYPSWLHAILKQKDEDEIALDLFLASGTPILTAHIYKALDYDIGLRKLCEACNTRKQLPIDWNEKKNRYSSSRRQQLDHRIKSGIDYPGSMLLTKKEQETVLGDETGEKSEDLKNQIRNQFQIFQTMMKENETSKEH